MKHGTLQGLQSTRQDGENQDDASSCGNRPELAGVEQEAEQNHVAPPPRDSAEFQLDTRVFQEGGEGGYSGWVHQELPCCRNEQRLIFYTTLLPILSMCLV